MARSDEFLMLFLKVHQIIGIHRNQPKYSINSRKIFSLFCNAQFGLTSIAFLVSDANSMFGYGFGFFLFIFVIDSMLNYFLFNWQFGNTLRFIENCHGFIEKRECRLPNGIWNTKQLQLKNACDGIFNQFI